MLRSKRSRAAGPLARMVVKVKQKHVGDKTNHKPGRSFQYSLESWSHEKRIQSIHMPCLWCAHQAR